MNSLLANHTYRLYGSTDNYVCLRLVIVRRLCSFCDHLHNKDFLVTNGSMIYLRNELKDINFIFDRLKIIDIHDDREAKVHFNLLKRLIDDLNRLLSRDVVNINAIASNKEVHNAFIRDLESYFVG